MDEETTGCLSCLGCLVVLIVIGGGGLVFAFAVLMWWVENFGPL